MFPKIPGYSSLLKRVKKYDKELHELAEETSEMMLAKWKKGF